MTPHQLLTTLTTAGVTLTLHGDRVTYRAPKGAMTPDLKAALTLHRQALLVALQVPQPVPVPAWDTCTIAPGMPHDPWYEAGAFWCHMCGYPLTLDKGGAYA
jgi:hypothetical protein